MADVGAYEAKTHFAQLLDRVEHGERIVITRHGTPVAVLQPPDRPTLSVPEVMAAMHTLRAGLQQKASAAEIRTWIDEGRD